MQQCHRMLPEDKRTQIGELASAAARSVGKPWRPWALAGVVAVVGEALRDELIEEALALGTTTPSQSSFPTCRRTVPGAWPARPQYP